MYPRPFSYHRASSLKEAGALLAELGEDAKAIAGGQSLLPLMKLRFANPAHLIDLNFISDVAFIREGRSTLHFGAMTRHAEIEKSEAAARIPIVHDCAAGIADVQVRNRGTIGGSVAEADPSGDWVTVLSTLDATVHSVGPNGKRSFPLGDFVTDAYTTLLQHDELVSEVVVKVPSKGSGGAYLAFKRSAPVYPSASAAVQLTMKGDVCTEAAIALGCVGLRAIRPLEAEAALRGQKLDEKAIERAGEAARAAADPQRDMRGSADYKRMLVGSLVQRAIRIAARRARGEKVEVSHIYG
jgi:aerobic carbon-monoxide dehydrogenase medium subunit